MKKNNINPILFITAGLIFLTASLSQARDGEIGNETVTPGGLPASAVLDPCKEILSWSNFESKMMADIGFGDYLNVVRKIHPSFYQKLLSYGKTIKVCLSEQTVESIFTTIAPAKNPRMAIWVKRGIGENDLLFISNPQFYGADITPALRASTVVRELLHPLFSEAYAKNIETRTDFMKHDLNRQIAIAYSASATSQRDQEFARVIQLLDEYQIKNVIGDLREVCITMTPFDCLNMYNARNRYEGSAISALASRYIGVSPIKTAEFLLSKITKIPEQYMLSTFAEWIGASIKIDTVEVAGLITKLNEIENLLERNKQYIESFVWAQFSNELVKYSSNLLSYLKYDKNALEKANAAMTFRNHLIEKYGLENKAEFQMVDSMQSFIAESPYEQLNLKINFLKNYGVAISDILTNADSRKYMARAVINCDNRSPEELKTFIRQQPDFVKGLRADLKEIVTSYDKSTSGWANRKYRNTALEEKARLLNL